jgi:hypothetical protein
MKKSTQAKVLAALDRAYDRVLIENNDAAFLEALRKLRDEVDRSLKIASAETQEPEAPKPET